MDSPIIMAAEIIRAKAIATMLGSIVAWKYDVPMTRYGMKLIIEKM